jgi:uncharacterized protein YndB with AHSA1/START domain
MSNETYIDVAVTRQFNFPPERVFDAFLDVQKARQFMFATEAGEMVRAEVDPRVGGKFVFTDRREEGEVEHVGEFVEIDRPRRLVFVYGIPMYSPDQDRVTVEISPLESGCEVKLTHALNPKWADYAERTKQGWTMILAGLEKTLG